MGLFRLDKFEWFCFISILVIIVFCLIDVFYFKEWSIGSFEEFISEWRRRLRC